MSKDSLKVTFWKEDRDLTPYKPLYIWTPISTGGVETTILTAFANWKSNPIVTLCGSLKYEVDINEWFDRLTEANCAVFNISKIPRWELQYFKIRRSDAIFVVNKDGYIDDDTFREIMYARNCHVPVIYLEDPALLWKNPASKTNDIIGGD